MSDFDGEAVARICEHMNEDHADAVASYARYYAQLAGVDGATLVALDATGMDLDVRLRDERRQVRVPFAAPLRDAGEARDALIAMAREAAGAA